MLKIKLSDKARTDMQDAAMYYNRQQAGLGKRFEKTIKSTFKRIQQMPQAASFAFDEVRYKTVEHFPFVVLYKFDDNAIRVIRVFNTYLDDNYQ